MAGKYFEDLHVNQVIKHSNGRTVTEMDNVLFSALTMNRSISAGFSCGSAAEETMTA